MSTRGLSSSSSTSSPALPRARRAQPVWERCLRRAEKQIDRGEYEQAITSLQQAASGGADGYACALCIADLHRSLQRWTCAYAAAETAVALDPKRLPAREMVMTIALEAGDSARAIAASQALIKIAPRHIPAHNTLGAAYFQQGDVDAAMRVANTLIRLDPETAAHHFKKAILCQHKGEVALAVQEFCETLRLDPGGLHAEAAREALESLDTFQINQILSLAMEDTVFCIKLKRDAAEATLERGFYLSEIGNQILAEISSHTLPEIPGSCRPRVYN